MIIAEMTIVVTTDNQAEHEGAKSILLEANFVLQDDPAVPNRFTATYTQRLETL